jgi:hypothetical protein
VTSFPGGRQRRYVRAAAHVHSEWSDDGSWSLRDIATTFARLGHDVVLMSEHSRGFSAAKWQEYIDACGEASNERVLLVPGIEYGDEDDVVHIPMWGPVPFFGDAQPIGRLLAEASDAGGIAMLAHPWRRDAWQRFEPSWLDHLIAVEVWNRKYDGVAPSRDAIALAKRLGTRPTVALDFHTRRQLFPLTLRLSVDAALTVTAIHDALATGRWSPRLLGVPLNLLASGPGAVALRGLEVVRRTAAGTLR